MLAVGASALALSCAPALADTRYIFNSETFSRFVGRTHAILVHFPIALLIVAAVVECFAAIRDRRLPPDARRSISPVSITCIAIGALGSIAAAIAGWLNAANEAPGSSVADALFWHRWLGIGVSGLAVIILFLALIARSAASFTLAAIYRASLVLAAILVGFVGHLGGGMVYGDNYLLAAFEDRSPSPARDSGPVLASAIKAQSPESLALAAKVTEILADRCTDCHGTRKQKGDLRLDTLDRAAASAAIVPGHPDRSDLIQRLLLDPQHADFMPQDDDPVPQDEIETLKAWITSLDPSQPPQPPQPASAQLAAAPPTAPKTAAGPPVPTITLTADQKLRRDQAMGALRSAGAFAAPISSDSELIHINLGMLGKSCSDQTLALLSGLEPCLYELNLSGTAITDAGIKSLAPFDRLERINLSRTAITDAGITELARIPRLSSLNLHNTVITDAAIDAMSGMPSLRRAYLWRTGMTESGLAKLAQARTDLTVELGAVFALPPEPAAQLAGQASGSSATPPAPPAAADTPPVPTPEDPPATEPATTVAAAKPGCCKSAEAAGHACDHPCCVEAAKQGKVCQKCLGN